jgi:hypothetical protein
MSEKTITLSQNYYDQLQRDSEFLECLYSAGVDNWDGYEEAQKMMYEDMHARWTPDKGKSFRQGMVQQSAKERNQGGQARPRAATGQAVARGNAMGDAPLPQQAQAAAHFGAQNDMIAQTNAVIGNEMANRRKLAENERDRQHEYEMESMRQQGASQRAEPQGGFGGGFQQQDAARQARNRSLLGMAGLGGHTISSGSNGVSVTPHPFQGPLARSLLG